MTFLVSCSSNTVDKDTILGKWQVVEYTTDMKEISPIVLEGAKEIALSSSYEFKKEFTCTFKSSIDSYNGTWSLEGKQINMNFDIEPYNNGDESYEIIGFSEGKMTWFMEFEYGKAETVLRKE